MCSVKKMFLEISQNLQKNTCAKDFAKFPSFAKFLGTPFLTEHLRLVLLKINTRTLDARQDTCFLLNNGPKR